MSQERTRAVPIISVPPDHEAEQRQRNADRAAFKRFVAEMGKVNVRLPQLPVLNCAAQPLVFSPALPLAERVGALTGGFQLDYVAATKFAAIELTAPLPGSAAVDGALAALEASHSPVQVERAAAWLVEEALAENRRVFHETLVLCCTRAFAAIEMPVVHFDTLPSGATALLATDGQGRSINVEVQTNDEPRFVAETLNAGADCNRLMEDFENALAATGVSLGDGWLRRTGPGATSHRRDLASYQAVASQ